MFILYTTYNCINKISVTTKRFAVQKERREKNIYFYCRKRRVQARIAENYVKINVIAHE